LHQRTKSDGYAGELRLKPSSITQPFPSKASTEAAAGTSEEKRETDLFPTPVL